VALLAQTTASPGAPSAAAPNALASLANALLASSPAAAYPTGLGATGGREAVAAAAFALSREQVVVLSQRASAGVGSGTDLQEAKELILPGEVPGGEPQLDPAVRSPAKAVRVLSGLFDADDHVRITEAILQGPPPGPPAVPLPRPGGTLPAAAEAAPHGPPPEEAPDLLGAAPPSWGPAPGPVAEPEDSPFALWLTVPILAACCGRPARRPRPAAANHPYLMAPHI
jgi:hypothetical protein